MNKWHKGKVYQRTESRYHISDLKLLTTNNVKTDKGQAKGHMTAILYLSPARSGSTGVNLCRSASVGCLKACLYNSGASIMFKLINEARRKRTRYLIEDRTSFLNDLVSDLETFERRATKRGFIPSVRLNGTSDLAWERLPVARENRVYPNIMEAFSNLQFYDYTKRTDRRFDSLPRNYSITFSRSENNWIDCLNMLDRGFNVAVVFKLRRKQSLPIEYEGFPVVNGDNDDIRYIDPKGCIIGLRAKARALKDTSGFAIDLRTGGIEL